MAVFNRNDKVFRMVVRMFLSERVVSWVVSQRHRGNISFSIARLIFKKVFILRDSAWKCRDRLRARNILKVAERLINLIPRVLPASIKFDLVKKLRANHFKTRNIHVNSFPEAWRQDILKPIQELLWSSSSVLAAGICNGKGDVAGQ